MTQWYEIVGDTAFGETVFAEVDDETAAGVLLRAVLDDVQAGKIDARNVRMRPAQPTTEGV